MNARKTKAMITLPPPPFLSESSEAYHRRYDKRLPTYRERKARKVSCPVCHKVMREQSLTQHLQEIHLRCATAAYTRQSSRGRLYHVNMPDHTAFCPVQDCPFTAHNGYGMRRHFAIIHPHDDVIISQEGSLPRCTSCGIRITSIGPNHCKSKLCVTLTARRKAFETAQQHARATKTVFCIGSTPIETVSEFKYLGRMIATNDRDDLAVTARIKAARAKWMQLYRILSADGVDRKTMTRFYLAIVQAVLLYGSESMVLSSRLLQRLERFHLRCTRWLCHRHIRRRVDGTWEHPPSNEILDACGLSPIRTYIAKRQTTLLHYASTSSPLYQRCLDSLPAPGAQRQQLLWWMHSI